MRAAQLCTQVGCAQPAGCGAAPCASSRQRIPSTSGYSFPPALNDYRTNVHHTLKTNPLRYEHLKDFVACATAKKRKEAERFKAFTLDELIARDKVSLDIFWLRDESLEDTADLPPPEVIAQEIVEDLEAALAEFAQIAATLTPGAEEQ